jgi:hypothetical protein
MCAAVRCERRHYVQANAANRTTTVPVAGRKSLHHKTLWFLRSPREDAYVRAAAAIRGATLQLVGWTRNAERAPIQPTSPARSPRLAASRVKITSATARRAFSHPILGPTDSLGGRHPASPRYHHALSSAEFQSGIDLTDVTRGKESRAARLSDGNSAIVELATRRRGADALKVFECRTSCRSSPRARARGSSRN